MILIADSGSTKTSWWVADPGSGTVKTMNTQGINPFYQEEEAIFSMLTAEFPDRPAQVSAIHFYGAGCAGPEVNAIVEKALIRYFKTGNISVESDLMAAARALCQHEPGIACILGTGSNSCLYDGTAIRQQVSPLGFILGDEGSGGALGKTLLSDVLKNQLPPEIIRKFFEAYPVHAGEILENIYRKPFPNRYAARFTPFLLSSLDHPAVAALVENELDRFFSRNIVQYERYTELPVHFTGSIAWNFRKSLIRVASRYAIKTGIITPSPREGLLKFHGFRQDIAE